jgi:hypothetical protein
MLENPWKISLYSPASLTAGDAGHYLGDVWSLQSLALTVRHNVASTAVIAVGLGDAVAPALMSDGVRAKIWRNGELLFTGRIDSVSVNGPWFKGLVQATLISDWEIMHDFITHPYGLSTEGTDPQQYWKYTGAAEDAVKELLSTMTNKWGFSSLGVEVSTHRGSTVSISSRYEDLYNAIFPQFDQSGVGLKIEHNGTQLYASVYDIVDYPTVLDEDSGIVADWSFTTAAPKANKVVSGATYTPTGGGSGQFVYETAQDTASQATWGLRVAYQAADGGTSGNTLADVQAGCQSSADTQLQQSDVRNGISVKLTETGQFQYGQASGLVVGKRVTIALNGITRTDILREVQFNFSTDAGDQTVPVVGDISDDPDRNIASYLAQLKKGIKRLEVKN